MRGAVGRTAPLGSRWSGGPLPRTAWRTEGYAEKPGDGPAFYFCQSLKFLITVGISRSLPKSLDAIAFQTADLIACMEKDSGLPLKELRMDGGASRSNPLLQFQADLLDAEVIRPKCIETTALGAACLAGLATGFWSSRDEIARNG